MALTYAQIKGGQGVAPGVIIPFSREVQSANQQLSRVPGGYLRCNGTVFQARDYPDLARVIGVGASGGGGVSGCRFPPGISGTSLLNPTFIKKDHGKLPPCPSQPDPLSILSSYHPTGPERG